MIDLYTYRTSNGRKVSIMLEECGLAYETRIVDITAGEQNAPDFLAISPNGRIPAIVDADGPAGRPMPLFESGAILLYLADKTGRFLPANEDGRWTAIEWLMWQMGGVGPNFGQAFHFLHQHPDDAPQKDIVYGRDRYGGEVRRLCGVMDRRLTEHAYLAGDDYSVADIATFPWVALHKWFDLYLGETPHLQRWYDDIRERPAVRRGMDVPTRGALERHATSV
ncbi:MAG: glutathione S-transferase family protein [Alphaproteobacteria bacterium]